VDDDVAIVGFDDADLKEKSGRVGADQHDVEVIVVELERGDRVRICVDDVGVSDTVLPGALRNVRVHTPSSYVDAGDDVPSEIVDEPVRRVDHERRRRVSLRSWASSSAPASRRDVTLSTRGWVALAVAVISVVTAVASIVIAWFGLHVANRTHDADERGTRSTGYVP
jgi:hypothetical protein